MSEIRILNAQAIESVMTIKAAVEAVERAYLQKHSGAGEVWPMVFHEFEHGVADLDIKSGNLDDENIFGLKLVSWYGTNSAKSLPALFGTAMIFDRETGAPKAVLNAGAITAYRTGAAGAIGAKYLSRKDSKSLLLFGCGHLAPYLIAASLYAMPHLEQISVISPRSPEKAAAALPKLIADVDKLLKDSGAERKAEISAAAELEQAVRSSDIILTATPSYSPMIRADWVSPGTHFSCIGADLSGKEEIEADIFVNARVFGDDQAQCFSVGECEIPYKTGKLKALQAEIGAVIAGADAGRVSDEEVTIFDSTGIALQDLASAAVIIKLAEEKNIGLVAEL